MALVSGGISTLNPDAPLYIPAALRQVEDFSPEWWQLITTSTWFHDYWLSQHQGDYAFDDNVEEDAEGDDISYFLPETFDFDPTDEFASIEEQFDEFVQLSESEEKPVN